MVRDNFLVMLVGLHGDNVDSPFGIILLERSDVLDWSRPSQPLKISEVLILDICLKLKVDTTWSSIVKNR